MKIYTKTGDSGQTSLLSGQRVQKNHARIEAYGTIDELNSFIGFLSSYELPTKIKNTLSNIQNTLFIAGSQLAVEGKTSFKLPEIEETSINLLESEIDFMEKSLPALKNFVLPGGCPENASAHVCRSVCRRAERQVVAFSEIDQRIAKYLNRLSDYFFVLSRYLSHLKNCDENLWLST